MRFSITAVTFILAATMTSAAVIPRTPEPTVRAVAEPPKQVRDEVPAPAAVARQIPPTGIEDTRRRVHAREFRARLPRTPGEATQVRDEIPAPAPIARQAPPTGGDDFDLHRRVHARDFHARERPENTQARKRGPQGRRHARDFKDQH